MSKTYGNPLFAQPPAHLKPKFNVGDTVYPRCCPYQYPRIITGLVIRENERVSYLASNDDCEREYQDYELSYSKSEI